MRDYDAMVKNVKSKVEQMVNARSWEEFSGEKQPEKPDGRQTAILNLRLTYIVKNALEISFKDCFHVVHLSF